MRLRNALALGVTAATTGTAVLALAVGPSSADPGPTQATGSEAGAGSESRAGAPGSEDEAGSVLSPGAGLDTGAGVGLRADAEAHPGFRPRRDSGAGSLLEAEAEPEAVAEAEAEADADARSGSETTPGAVSGTRTDTGAGTRDGTDAGTSAAPEARPDARPDTRPAVEAGTATTQRQQPSPCGEVTDPEFPIDTRIHRRPGAFVPGADFRTFEVDLTNTTAEACQGIHPVLVLTDRDRVLRPEQIRLEFYDSEALRWYPVAFEATEEDENVGAFSGPAEPSGPPGPFDPSGRPTPSGFSGFTVPAGRTVTVSVRLAFREDAAPNAVVVNAAVVQRHGADGEWVGESDDVGLTIGPEGTEETSAPSPEPSPEATPEPNPEGDPQDIPQESPRPLPSGTNPPTSDGTGVPTTPTPLPPELAETGPESIALLAPASGALLLTGASLVVASRRSRRSQHSQNSQDQGSA